MPITPRPANFISMLGRILQRVLQQVPAATSEHRSGPAMSSRMHLCDLLQHWQALGFSPSGSFVHQDQAGACADELVAQCERFAGLLVLGRVFGQPSYTAHAGDDAGVVRGTWRAVLCVLPSIVQRSSGGDSGLCGMRAKMDGLAVQQPVWQRALPQRRLRPVHRDPDHRRRAGAGMS